MPMISHRIAIKDADGLLLLYQDISGHNADQYQIMPPGICIYKATSVVPKKNATHTGRMIFSHIP